MGIRRRRYRRRRRIQLVGAVTAPAPVHPEGETKGSYPEEKESSFLPFDQQSYPIQGLLSYQRESR